jgi:hypothetical protein
MLKILIALKSFARWLFIREARDWDDDEEINWT